jgi:hypothetical protein
VVAEKHPVCSVAHAVPAGQQRRLAPVPHGVEPAGQPHMPCETLMHATPFRQQDVPHGVSPLQQHVTVAGSEHVSFLLQHPAPQKVLMLGSQPQRGRLGSAQMRPAGQQPWPHGVRPGWHPSVCASPRKGRSTVATVAAAAAAPTIFSTLLRELPLPSALDICSKCSLMCPSPSGPQHPSVRTDRSKPRCPMGART